MPEADAGNGVGVGELLRSAREARGITLEQATRTTKISKNYLTAIEEGRFEKLPNPAYIKGFLRLYANFLGLSADHVVARYEATLPAPAETPQGVAEHPPIEVVERVRFGGHGRWAVPALLLCLVILAAIFLTEGEERRERPAPPPPPAPKPAPAPAVAPPPAPVQPALSSARQPQPGTPPAAPGQEGAVQPSAPPAKGVMLRLRFNRDSWLTITIDDSITQRYDLKAGDIIEWKGERQFSLDLGDGGAVEAEFNGRPLKSLGEPGRPVHVELKGEGQQ